MEQLFTQSPMLRFKYNSIDTRRTQLINQAATFNIATGFISSDALAELRRMVALRNGGLTVNLFIGMNYINGFTQLQYSVLKDLNDYLTINNFGKVYVSPNALFHGKLYSFTDITNRCLGGFVGSSNLSSFLSSSHAYIESDIFFPGTQGSTVDSNIKSIIRDLGVEFSSANPITSFLPKETDLLKGTEGVKKLSDDEFKDAKAHLTNLSIEIPLKTEDKSNLNTYFGAGKTPNRYSPRSWYEVEIIIPQKTLNIDRLPDKNSPPFTVITPNHYSFLCERQGDNSKNLRSSGNLRILGKWIKGEMESEGVLRCGQKVTQKTLDAFGKSKIVLTKAKNDCWFIEMR